MICKDLVDYFIFYYDSEELEEFFDYPFI